MAGQRLHRTTSFFWGVLALSLAAAPTAGFQVQQAGPPPSHPSGLRLSEIVRLGLDQHPRLTKAGFSVDAARGKAIQAGLYPNPVISVTGDELGDVEGPGGIWTAPQVNQEIVTGGKLRLVRAAAERETDQATYFVQAERLQLLAGIRAAFYETLALEQRIVILRDLVKLADQSVEQTNKLVAAQVAARLDLVQLEVEAERLRTDLEAAEREVQGAYRRLAAAAGLPQLPPGRVVGDLEQSLPPYDLDRSQAVMLAVHPDLSISRLGVDRARIQLERERVEPIPNFNVGAGYVRQNQNKSNDWVIGVSFPIPAWNRNQGNILAAGAQIGVAEQEVRRVENDLIDRLAVAMRDFASAQRRVERYKAAILPRAKETYELSLKAYRGGQFEYLRVLEAQRAVAQTNLEYVRALGDAWKAASVVSGLTQEETWPPPSVPRHPTEPRP